MPELFAGQTVDLLQQFPLLSLVRFTGYVSVTVTDPGELADALTALEADAATARIEIRRMWGAQDVGFALAALPAGLGLPRRRW